MSASSVRTPVAFFVFNRPDTTRVVFEQIAAARPRTLLLVADGPRENRIGEAERVAAVRALVDRVDWPCEVLRNYSETNLGCKLRVSSGLDWVFSCVDEAIILEDDCVPHPTFFRFCEELLDRYRDDERVMHIGGCNVQFGQRRTEDSYYYSRYNHIWGWASWRRVWRYYDVGIVQWPEFERHGLLDQLLRERVAVRYWADCFRAVHEGRLDTWDYQYTFACWSQGGVSILPSVNLVSNIGFGQEATHTKARGRLANLPVEEMSFPLKHPRFVVRNTDADAFTERLAFRPPAFYSVRSALARLLKRDRG